MEIKGVSIEDLYNKLYSGSFDRRSKYYHLIGKKSIRLGKVFRSEFTTFRDTLIKMGYKKGSIILKITSRQITPNNISIISKSKADVISEKETQRHHKRVTKIKSNSKEGFRGVSLHKLTGLFISTIMVNGKSYITYHKTALDGALHYDKLVRKFGLDKITNFGENSLYGDLDKYTEDILIK